MIEVAEPITTGFVTEYGLRLLWDTGNGTRKFTSLPDPDDEDERGWIELIFQDDRGDGDSVFAVVYSHPSIGEGSIRMDNPNRQRLCMICQALGVQLKV